MLYDFKCLNCGYEEKDRFYTKPKDNTPEKCPKCGAEKFVKQITQTYFKLNWKRGGY